MIRPIARSAVLTCALGAFVLGGCGSDSNTAGSTPAADTSVVDSTPAVTDAPPVVTDAASVPATVDNTTAAPATDVAQTDATGTGAPAAGAGLTIADFSFSQGSGTAGAEFTLTNDDDFAHTVTDRDGAFDVRVEGGSTAPLTIDRAGTYEIFCRIHPSMSGTITVV